MRCRLLPLLALALTPSLIAADGDEVSEGPSSSWLDHGREISRATSASRDTPAMTMAVFPRATLTAGAELAILRLRWPSFTLRTGFAGMLEIESDGETDGNNSGLAPSGSGKILWRGSYAYFAGLSLDGWAATMCRGCGVEFVLSYRHESQHYSGSNYGDGGSEDVSHQPYVGDALILDAALRQQVGEWRFVERLEGQWFLPGRSSYAGGLGLDLHVRWTGWDRAQPFVSAAASYWIGDDIIGRTFPDAYRVRGLFGVALPSSLGDVMVYLSADVGHRYGVRGLHEEATFGLGARLGLGGR